MTHKDGSIYIGQFFMAMKLGYGLITYEDGSSYAGFFYKNQPHGIGVKTDSKNKKVYTHNQVVTDEWNRVIDTELVSELSLEDVEAINNGTKHIPQMDVFFQD